LPKVWKIFPRLEQTVPNLGKTFPKVEPGRKLPWHLAGTWHRHFPDLDKPFIISKNHFPNLGNPSTTLEIAPVMPCRRLGKFSNRTAALTQSLFKTDGRTLLPTKWTEKPVFDYKTEKWPGGANFAEPFMGTWI